MSRALLLTLLLLGCEAHPIPGADAGDGAVQTDAGLPDAGPADSGPTDAGPTDAGPTDAGPVDAGPGDAGPPPPPPPASVFFVGNSFTFGGPVPTLVEDLAIYAGFPPPNVEYRAIGGQTLEGHRADGDPDGAPARVAEGWDAVVLQEHSVRPTDSVGPAARFYEDATWFYDLAKTANPAAEIVLYETWARRFNHSIYPDPFTDPADMQAQLRYHYYYAAEEHVPANRASDAPLSIRVAPAGDAWELQLAGGEPPKLHGSDDYHAGPAGQYLNALVLYSTLFRRRADGLVPLRGLDAATAAALQRAADDVTGEEGFGVLGPSPLLPVSAGDAIAIDVGPLPASGWTALTASALTAPDVATESGAATRAHVTSWGFSGTQEGGAADNVLGWPGDVSRDTLWVGSFDGHAAALEMEARLVVRGLPDGAYRLELFASRDGDDSGRGRLTRYRVGDRFVDLEVTDNRGTVARLEDVRPDARGEIVLRVGVSPEGGARFAYAGALRVVRTGE